jgi:hypothetical protein
MNFFPETASEQRDKGFNCGLAESTCSSIYRGIKWLNSRNLTRAMIEGEQVSDKYIDWPFATMVPDRGAGELSSMRPQLP